MKAAAPAPATGDLVARLRDLVDWVDEDKRNGVFFDAEEGKELQQAVREAADTLEKG